MIGPIDIVRNSINYNPNLISIHNMVVYIYGAMITSHNSAQAHSIWQFFSCEVIFYGMILFKYNVCDQVISLNMQQPYMKVMEYANITFISNMCTKKLIEVLQGTRLSLMASHITDFLRILSLFSPF